MPLLREERLASGINGKITHVKIVDGYVMPKNNIKVVSAKAYDSKTVIELDMNRSVVFNIKLTGQTYGLYNDRRVTVSSLNCSGVEITFSDTASAGENMAFVNSVIKGGKWSVNKSASTVTLSLELAQKGKFYGFHCEYNEKGNLVLSFKHKPSSSLSGYTIMLDPGHGGIDGGAGCAVSSTDFGQEKNINLSIATKVKALLEAEGAKVVMTRTGDKWVCYADRNAAVRKQDPDMFIAIHCDSSSTASAMGTSAYYYRAYSQPLAKALHQSIVAAYKSDIYADKPDSFKNKVSRGANFYAFRVTRVEECPAVLIEYGFVSNTDECQVLQNAKNRDTLAKATVEGIKNTSARAEPLLNGGAEHKSRQTEGKPPERKERADLTHYIKRLLRVIPHIPAEPEVDHRPDGEFKARDNKRPEQAAQEDIDIPAAVYQHEERHYRAARERHCPMGIAPHYHLDSAVDKRPQPENYNVFPYPCFHHPSPDLGLTKEVLLCGN